jgi:hypothetical protein
MTLLVIADAFGLRVIERENSIVFADRRYRFNELDQITEVYDFRTRERFLSESPPYGG